MKHALLLLAACCLPACAATTSVPASPEAMRAAALARLLQDTAVQDPARIGAAQDEMAALEQALLAQPAAEPAPDPEPAPAPLPAPDLAGARSILHGVHLTSYRDQAHVAPGWRALQGTMPALAGLSARVAPADLGERGAYLRLKAGPFDSRDAAQALCARLQAEGHWCQPVDFTGEPVAYSTGPDGG